jgi:Trypsin-like peptidase domain
MAGVALWLAACVAQANIFVLDRREQREGSAPPFRSVGVIHHRSHGGGGTAFLVGRCHVLTAYHVAFMGETNAATGKADVLPGRVGHVAEFLAGPVATEAGRFASATRARVVQYGRFSDVDYKGMAGDWAILRLDECLGRKYGFLAFAPDSGEPMPAGALMTAGFPHSRRQQPGITVEVGCRARDHGPAPGLVGVDCAFESGMSGGPVLERQRDGRWLVVGLIQQSTGRADAVLPSYSMEHRNQMVYVTAFWRALDKVLGSEGKPVPGDRAR